MQKNAGRHRRLTAICFAMCQTEARGKFPPEL